MDKQSVVCSATRTLSTRSSFPSDGIHWQSVMFPSESAIAAVGFSRADPWHLELRRQCNAEMVVLGTDHLISGIAGKSSDCICLLHDMSSNSLLRPKGGCIAHFYTIGGLLWIKVKDKALSDSLRL